MAWMYILRCSDNSYYTGSCPDLELRVWQHSTGKGSKYTSTRLPVELVFAVEYDNPADALSKKDFSKRKPG